MFRKIILGILAIITAFSIRAVVIQYVYYLGNKPPAYLTEDFVYPKQYSREEVILAMKYHGIYHCKEDTYTGEWWFYRDGNRCNLFTEGAIKYVNNNLKK